MVRTRSSLVAEGKEFLSVPFLILRNRPPVNLSFEPFEICEDGVFLCSVIFFPGADTPPGLSLDLMQPEYILKPQTSQPFFFRLFDCIFVWVCFPCDFM